MAGSAKQTRNHAGIRFNKLVSAKTAQDNNSRSRSRSTAGGRTGRSASRSAVGRTTTGTRSAKASTGTRKRTATSRNAQTDEVGSRGVTNTTRAHTSDHVHPVVIGIFTERAQAECAEKELRRAGFKENQLGVAMRDEGNRDARAEGGEQGNKAGEGATKGLVTGGVVGGLLAAAAAMLLPGVGPVLAGGILATMVAGAATGAVAGGVLGSLVGLGIPEEEARYYEQQFEAGRIIMTARANGRHEEATRILRSCGSYDIHNQSVGTDEQIRLEPHGDESETEEPHATAMAIHAETNRAMRKRA